MPTSSTARSSSSSTHSESGDTSRSRRQLGDPLGPILALGRRHVRVGAAIGIAGALIVHGAPAMQAARSFGDLRDFAGQVRELIDERLKSEIDLDTTPPPPPPPPPPEPEPEPEPPKEAAPPPKAEPEAPPPAPAEAGKILTSEPDPDEPVDLTDQGFVTGTSERFAGGTTASTGTSKTAVRSADATPGGVPGGTGKPSAVGAPAPAQDLSRAPMPTNAQSWRNCGFPAEADIENINSAVVTLIVTVGPDGRAKSVNVVKDFGYGFGKLARDCAFRQSFSTGLDAAGKPVTKTTPPFTVRFNR